MSFTVILYKNKSAKNKIDKDLTQIQKYENCVVKNDTDISNPVININDTLPHIIAGNYVYVEDFDRYYFVENVTTLTGRIQALTLKCDVLMSFKEDILNSYCISLDSEKHYNLMLDDGTLNAYQNPNRWLKKFSNVNETRNFKLILTTAGG